MVFFYGFGINFPNFRWGRQKMGQWTIYLGKPVKKSRKKGSFLGGLPMKMIPAPEKMGVVIWKSVGETWISSGKNGQKCEICTIKARSGPPFLVLFGGEKSATLRTLDISIRKFRVGISGGRFGGGGFGGSQKEGGDKRGVQFRWGGPKGGGGSRRPVPISTE